MLRIPCECGGFLESHMLLPRSWKVVFVCWRCHRIELYRFDELNKLPVDLDATLNYELHKLEVRNLAVFGVHYGY